MSRSSRLTLPLLCLGMLTAGFSACSSSSSQFPYTLAASGLSPANVTAGNASTSTITVTPENGYTGSITLSCSKISGGTPPPACSFNPSVVTMGGTSAVTSILTVSTSASTPGGPYNIAVTAADTKHLSPRDRE